MKIVVLGASDTISRFSYRAVIALKLAGYTVVPVSQRRITIAGLQSVESLEEAGFGVDTVSVYLNPSRFGEMLDSVIAVAPRRVIFNPGAECADAEPILRERGIEVIYGCTLVMLDSGGF